MERVNNEEERENKIVKEFKLVCLYDKERDSIRNRVESNRLCVYVCRFCLCERVRKKEREREFATIF
jgi:hypothetical protein